MTDFTKSRVLLFRGKGLVSALIRFQTRGEFSHLALFHPDGLIREAWQGTGVRKKRLRSWTGVTAFKIPDMTITQWRKAFQWADLQLGKKYDYLSVARFVTHRKPPENDKWFCSEYGVRAILNSGFPLFSDKADPSRIDPDLSTYSPYLVEDTEFEAP